MGGRQMGGCRCIRLAIGLRVCNNKELTNSNLVESPLEEEVHAN